MANNNPDINIRIYTQFYGKAVRKEVKYESIFRKRRLSPFKVSSGCKRIWCILSEPFLSDGAASSRKNS